MTNKPWLRFDWEKASLIKTGFFKDNDNEVCIYTDGNKYTAVSHSEDKSREFNDENELNDWIEKWMYRITNA